VVSSGKQKSIGSKKEEKCEFLDSQQITTTVFSFEVKKEDEILYTQEKRKGLILILCLT